MALSSLNTISIYFVKLELECTEDQLFNKRGTCVPRIQEFLRISRQFYHIFHAGDNETTSIAKCNDPRSPTFGEFKNINNLRRNFLYTNVGNHKNLENG